MKTGTAIFGSVLVSAAVLLIVTGHSNFVVGAALLAFWLFMLSAL